MARPKPSRRQILERVDALVAAGAAEQDAFHQLAQETGRAPEAIRAARDSSDWPRFFTAYTPGWTPGWPVVLAWAAVGLGLYLASAALDSGAVSGPGLVVLTLAWWGLLAVLYGIWSRVPGKVHGPMKVVAVGFVCLVVLVFLLSTLLNECEHAPDGRLIGSSWCH